MLKALPVWTYVEAAAVIGIWISAAYATGSLQVILIVVGVLATIHYSLNVAMFVGAELANRSLEKFQKDVNAGKRNRPSS